MSSSNQSQIRREALARQGTTVQCGNRRYFVPGSSDHADFEMGAEGLVQLAIDVETQVAYRIKCFWNPTQQRLQRSRLLVSQNLADLSKNVADALAGAPFFIVDRLGPYTPFALLMKNVHGISWMALKEKAQLDQQYPPPGWPPLEVRATWGYGLATAVRNMEARGFIHADLSPGNVMVTATGDTAGDMALVDFDSFLHPLQPNLDPAFHGTQGYSPPEVWRSEFARVGTDRLGMAILIQEFLVIGDPGISKEEAFGWAYDEVSELLSRNGKAHPLIKTKHPQIAALVEAAIAAPAPEARPAPESWRPLLRAIAMGEPHASSMARAALVPLVPTTEKIRLELDHLSSVDLMGTPFRIRASLQRESDGRIRLLVHSGAEVRIKSPENPHWRTLGSGGHAYVTPDTVVDDISGKLPFKVIAAGA